MDPTDRIALMDSLTSDQKASIVCGMDERDRTAYLASLSQEERAAMTQDLRSKLPADERRRFDAAMKAVEEDAVKERSKQNRKQANRPAKSGAQAPPVVDLEACLVSGGSLTELSPTSLNQAVMSMSEIDRGVFLASLTEEDRAHLIAAMATQGGDVSRLLAGFDPGEPYYHIWTYNPRFYSPMQA